MNSLRAVTENQIRASLNLSEEAFDALAHPSPNQLHDPSGYSDIDKMAALLQEEKRRQAEDPRRILAGIGDYDADGVCASAVMSAALSVLGFRYLLGVPTMEDGYGLNEAIIDRVCAQAEKAGYKLDMILTADNGIKAYQGVGYAVTKGIPVLVTDHHPAGTLLPRAAACVDPWKVGDEYPFNYNSGATVVWKVFLEYAKQYDPEKLPLIENLILFAGISNVADVMPVTDENRYMVVRALAMIDHMRQAKSYEEIADTPYPAYNTAFWGIHDIVAMLQEDKNARRAAEGKDSVPLPRHEELISWYLGPMLNAPRRVHSTCLESMAALTISDHTVRRKIIGHLLELNAMKTKFRDDVLKEVEKRSSDMVFCVNARSGITGLIAGQLSGKTGLPSLVFTRYNPAREDLVYDEIPTDGILTASARSTDLYPLNLIMDEVNHRYPGLLRGGGHTTAAGFTIDAKNYGLLRSILPGICEKVFTQQMELAVPAAENKLILSCKGGTLSVTYNRVEGDEYVEYTEFLDTKSFAGDALETYKFLESLRPFGRGFEAQTVFELVFDQAVLSMKWNPDFWKTFKFDLFGVECLTFAVPWADEVKKTIKSAEEIRAKAVLQANTFRGVTTPQLLLSPCN